MSVKNGSRRREPAGLGQRLTLISSGPNIGEQARLLVSGAAALFLATTGHFLPHDERFLGMTAEQLCEYDGCRVVHFMVHDRAAFGGVLLAVGLLYLWLIEFPLRARAAWAWWSLVIERSRRLLQLSRVHRLWLSRRLAWGGHLGTLSMLRNWVISSWRTTTRPRGMGSLLVPGVRPVWRSADGIGRACLMIAALGVTGAGMTILTVGMTFGVRAAGFDISRRRRQRIARSQSAVGAAHRARPSWIRRGVAILRRGLDVMRLVRPAIAVVVAGVGTGRRRGIHTGDRRPYGDRIHRPDPPRPGRYGSGALYGWTGADLLPDDGSRRS